MKADKKTVMSLLKTVQGQIGGLMKMVEEDRYCIDISTQVMASVSILKKINTLLLSAHLKHCVQNSDAAGREKKLEEIADIIKKLSS